MCRCSPCRLVRRAHPTARRVITCVPLTHHASRHASAPPASKEPGRAAALMIVRRRRLGDGQFLCI
eukprot:6908143-Prymnesium_polylepis.1